MKTDILRGERLGEPAADAVTFTSSIDADQLLLDPVIKINKAHIVMLAKQKIISRSDASLCVKGLESISPSISLDPRLEDVHMNVEYKVIKAVGEEAGGQLNLAKSRNDQVATAIRMTLREYMLKIISALLRLREALLNRSLEHLNTIMAGYTHLQHAQPITLAHQFLAHHDALTRDCERLREAYNRVNSSPMGAAALATTSFQIDREFVAQLLGFEGLIENSIDAVGSRDFAIEVLSNLALVMTDLSRICEEMILWSSYEFGIASISDQYTSTSSIMPQKKNAVVAELIRAKDSVVLGELVTSLTILKALPYSYNLDLQELTPHLFNACETVLISTMILADMMEDVRFDVERMKKLVDEDMSNATELADYLVKEFGIPFRTSHKIVGILAKESIEKDLSFNLYVEDGLAEVVRKVAGKEVQVDKERLRKVMNPKDIVRRSEVLGGPSPSMVETAIASRKRLLSDETDFVKKRSMKLESALSRLDEYVKELKGDKER